MLWRQSRWWMRPVDRAAGFGVGHGIAEVAAVAHVDTMVVNEVRKVDRAVVVAAAVVVEMLQR